VRRPWWRWSPLLLRLWGTPPPAALRLPRPLAWGRHPPRRGCCRRGGRKRRRATFVGPAAYVGGRRIADGGGDFGRRLVLSCAHPVDPLAVGEVATGGRAESYCLSSMFLCAFVFPLEQAGKRILIDIFFIAISSPRYLPLLPPLPLRITRWSFSYSLTPSRR